MQVAYKHIDKTAQIKRIREKYRDKPESEEREQEYQLMVVASWVIGVLSALTAASLPLLYIYGILQDWMTAGAIALVVAGLYELYRRHRYEKLFKDYFKNSNRFGLGSSVAVVVLLLVGMGSSSVGTNMFIAQFHPAAELISFDEKAALLQSDLDEVRSDIEKYQNDPQYKVGKGKLAWHVSHKLLPPLEARKNDLKAELAEVQKQIEAQNGTIGVNHAEMVQANASYGGIALLILELLYFFIYKAKEKYEYLLMLESGGVGK